MTPRSYVGLMARGCEIVSARPQGRRTVATSVLATAIRAVALVVLFDIAGARAVGRVFGHAHLAWIALVAGAELLTYPTYVLAYRSIARFDQRGSLALPLVARMVVAGFGPFALSGGFGVDRELLEAIEGDERGARVRVSALGIMEWAVLAPLTCVVSIVFLASDAPIGGMLLWPWVLGVPAGLALAAWASDSTRAPRLVTADGRRLIWLAPVLDGIAAVRSMAQQPRSYAGAWLGLGLYWAADISAFLGALRMANLDLGAGRVILAYATGYLATRRSLPLGGAGVTEILLIYALHQLGQPLAASVAAVLIYRVFNFVLVTVPAVIAYRDLNPKHATPQSDDPTPDTRPD